MDCNYLPGDPIDLEYTNGLSGDCEISGVVSPTTEGEIDICGGDIIYTWTFTDPCGNEITHTQTIEIDPLPQAEFVDPPEDLITDCSDLPGDPAELFYTNGLDGDCEIEGTVAPDIVGEVDICGSEINYTWTFTDQCEREIEFTQTITVEPITPAEYIDPPENISVSCEEFSDDPEDLEYTNGLTGECEISGSVSPEVEGEFDLCGGEIIYTWSYEDFCGNELIHSQVVTIEPAPPVEFVDPPADTVVTCGNLPQDPPELLYSNGLSGDCEIFGYAAPETEGEVDDCGSEIVYSWTFIGPCGTEIIHVQQITIEPIPEAEFTEFPPDLNTTCGEPIEEVLAIGYTNNQNGDCAIEGTVNAERTGSIDQCGGFLVDVWTFIDDCGREISHSRTITVEPVQEASFIDPPEDIISSCSEAIDVPVSLYYTNGLVGDCLIEGEVEADISGRVETCGNVLTYTWTFSDDCDRTITHSQTITQEPAVEAVFIDPPEDTSVDCADVIIDPPVLTYRNSESTSECLIEGSVEAEVFENYNHCGGEVIFIWEFEDECGRTLQHQQTITVNPVPEAVFINPPPDLVVNCDEVPAFDIPLAYGNYLDGVCEISGEILPEVIGGYNSCGGEVVLQYTFTDDCGRTIEHQQQITILPPDLPEFLDPFEQVNVSCAEALDLFENPPLLEYTNHLTGECAINGSVSAESDGFWDECGGEIVLTWSEVVCGELLEYVHTVFVEPAPSAEFTDPPAVLILDCGESEPDPFPLHYNNFSDNICHIEGSVDPVLEYSGKEVIYTWSFTDICGEAIEYIWSVEVIPAPDIIVNPEFVFLCEGDSFDLGTVEVTDLNNSDPVITFHSDYPANAGNQLNNLIISPTENTSIFVRAVNDDDCESAAVITFQVDELSSAGNNGEDRLCFGEYDQIDLFSYLGNNYDQGGQWIDVNNSDVNLSDPSDVDFTGIAQGIYQFYYLFGPVGGCEGDTSVVSIELMPEIEIITNNIQCTADNESYQVSIHSPGLEITTNAGDLIAEGDDYYTVSKIDTSVNLIITASITGTTCTQDFEIAAPNCDCPPVPAPESNGDYTLCPEDDIPTLMVSLSNDSLIANWYDSPTGGNLLAEDTLSYLPAISGTGTYRFYVESQSLYFPDCRSFSRTPIVIEILPSPTANNASLESCDHSGDGFGEFHLEEAIPQISGNPNNTFTYHESEADAIDGEAPLPSPFVNSTPQLQTIYVRVVNPNGCVSIADLELIVLPAFEIEVESQSPTCINDEDGQATVEVNGPFGGFEYSLNQVDWFNENVFTNLSSGLYTVYIRDEEGCTGQSEFEIPAGLDIEIAFLEAICNDAGTSENPDDDFYEISFSLENNQGNTGEFEVELAGTLHGPYDYGITYTIGIPADGMVYLIAFTDLQTGCKAEQELGSLNTCSSDCLISISYLNYICRDNGTPSDPTDDYYVVDLETEIFNPGMDESFVVSVNGTPIDTAIYGTGIEFTLAADDSEPLIEVYDLNSPNCSASELLDSLLSCSDECAINIELQSVVCNNQGTEEDLNDDTFTAWVLVSGFNTAADWYIQGDPSEVFTYNEEVEIGGWLISNGSVTITVVDSEYSNCTVEVTIEPPSPCSEPCFIEASQIEIGPCDDFGTGIDPSDDLFSVSFVIDSLSGNNTKYTVSWESETQGPFEYGELTHIDSLLITGDTLELLIQDISNENCFFTIPVYQYPCSFNCQLTTGQVTFQCNDNGTPADPEDDFYEFTLIPEVLNPGQDSVFILAIDGQVMDTIDYGNEGYFTIAADGSQAMVEIVDFNNPDCSDSFQTEPLDPCSDQCLIDLVLNSLSCDHQGTEEDLIDDTFTAFVTANELNNSSDSWNVQGEPSTTYSYGEQVELGEWLIVDGPVTLTIVDSEDPNCTTEISIDPPPPCSEPCLIELVEIIIGQCNDSDTSTDPDDDFFGVTLTIDSLEGMASQYHVNWDGIIWGPFEYGQQANIDSLPASGDTLVLHVIDVSNSQCQLSFEVSQQPCSFDCLISIGEVNSLCNDSGTPTDPKDDFYEFSIIPEVLNPGQDSAFILTIDDQVIDTFEYKNGVTFTLSADGAQASIEIFDLNNNDCIASFQSDSLYPCSNQCLIELALNSVSCDNQGTDEDLLDDTFIAFVIATELNNSSDSWYVEGDPGTTYPYGEQVELGDWLILDGVVTITIVDSRDPNCTTELIITPPPPCSTPCEIEIDDIDIGECDDNNTGSNRDDDFFGVSFVVNDLDGNTSDFRVHWSGMSWGPFDYGQTVFIDSLPANGSNITLEVVDSQNSNCQTTFTVSRESCSSCDQMVNAGNDKILTCENPTVVLNGSASEPGEFNWKGPNGFTSEEEEPLVDRAGLYELTVVFENLCEFTDLVAVTMDGDFPDISAGDDKELNCSPGEVTLTGSVEGEIENYQIEWFDADGNSIGFGTELQTSQPGNYTLVVTDLLNGCVSNDIVEVRADPTSIENILINAVDPLCHDESNGFIEILHVEGGSPPVVFSFNGQPTDQHAFSNLSSGTYTLSALDDNGCKFDTTLILTNPDPLSIDLGPNLSLAQGEETFIQAFSNLDPDSIQSIYWTIDGVPVCDPCDKLGIHFTEGSEAVIEISIVDKNGCTASDRLHIFVIIERNVYIPNAFSPDEDGINDRFTIYGDKYVEEVEEMMIFNRWGAKVFEQRNFPPNDISYGWDGTFKSQENNPGTFVYSLQIRFVDGLVKSYSGDLILLR
nr:gliding motility-associated C-terminal domain-containing protein [Saprospiraceae bacterium]